MRERRVCERERRGRLAEDVAGVGGDDAGAAEELGRPELGSRGSRAGVGWVDLDEGNSLGFGLGSVFGLVCPNSKF